MEVDGCNNPDDYIYDLVWYMSIQFIMGRPCVNKDIRAAARGWCPYYYVGWLIAMLRIQSKGGVLSPCVRA